MMRLAIISTETEPVRRIRSALTGKGIECVIIPSFDSSGKSGAKPDIISVYINGALPGTGIWEMPGKLKTETGLPVLALISKAALEHADSLDGSDDFVIEPWDPGEIAVRARRLITRARNAQEKEQIRCGDLVIDLARCEVLLNGHRIELTFREYELLRFLAANPGRAYTRETLLNKVWGFDYFGGDRTVDVHVRRLRSKLGDPDETFIETVRNIGYRFRGGNKAPTGPDDQGTRGAKGVRNDERVSNAERVSAIMRR